MIIQRVYTLSSIICGILCGLLLPLQAQETYSKEVTAKDFQAALDALTGFVTAKTWEEGAKYVLDADKLKDRMAAHYAKHPWDNPEIVAVPNEVGNVFFGTVVYKVVFFDLVVKDLGRVLPVDFTSVDGEFKLNWEGFIQGYHSTFEEFIESQSTDTHTFLHTCRRAVPNSEASKFPLKGEVLRVRVKYRSFDVDQQGLRVDNIYDLYAGADTPAGAKVKEYLPFDPALTGDYDGPYRVELRWNKSGSSPFIEIVSLYKVNLQTPSMFPGEDEE